MVVMKQATEVQKEEQAYESLRERSKEAFGRLYACDRRIAVIDAELKDLDREKELVLDNPKKRDAVRAKQRKLLTEKDDLVAERPILARLVRTARGEEDVAFVNLHQSFRRAAQAEGSRVAEQIRTLLGDIEQRFLHWLRLKQEDRKSTDIIRSVDPRRIAENPTFAWSTSVDDLMAAAIQEAIRECDRCTSSLKKRESPLRA